MVSLYLSGVEADWNNDISSKKKKLHALQMLVLLLRTMDMTNIIVTWNEHVNIVIELQCHICWHGRWGKTEGKWLETPSWLNSGALCFMEQQTSDMVQKNKINN